MDADSVHWVYVNPYRFDVLLEVRELEPERVPVRGEFPLRTEDGAPPGADGWCVVKDSRHNRIVHAGLVRLLCRYTGPTETPTLRHRGHEIRAEYDPGAGGFFGRVRGAGEDEMEEVWGRDAEELEASFRFEVDDYLDWGEWLAAHPERPCPDGF